MKHWKGTCFVLSWALLAPSLFVLLHLNGCSVSLTWSSLLGLLYAWGIVNIVIPFFTSPLNSLPSPPTEHFFAAHSPVLISRPPGGNLLSIMQQVPNNGMIHLRGFAHCQSGVLLSSPDTLAEVLSNNPYDYHKPAAAKKYLSRTLGNGLVNAEGMEHKMQRKTVTPAFHGRHIKALIPTFWAKATQSTDSVASAMKQDGSPESEKTSGVVEISSMAQRMTLDIIGEAGLGRDLNTINNSDDELARQYAAILDPEGQKYPTLWFLTHALLPGWFVRLLPLKEIQRVGNATYNLRVICRRMVAEKREGLAEKSVEQINILAVLMKSGSFDDDGLVNQLLTFLAAGHETTSSAFTWASYLLSMHKDVQDRLRQDIKQYMAKSGSGQSVNAAVLNSMDYLNAVSDEVLRLFPPVPLTLRQAVRQTTVKDQILPKGSYVIICPWAINRLPSIWGHDAGEFNPDRWMGQGKSSHGGTGTAYGKITFLHGPRSCIGQGFARDELKCLLVALLLRFHVELANPDTAGTAIPEGMVTIKPKGGMYLRLTEISW